MTKQDLEQWAISKGFTLDKYGYLQKQTGDNEYRLKISSISARYEVKVHHEAGQYSPASSEWMRLQSGYLKNLSINDKGQLRGMAR